jgi:hypothetical protein
MCDSDNKLSVFENNLSSINLWKCVTSVSLSSSPLAMFWYESPKKVCKGDSSALWEVAEYIWDNPYEGKTPQTNFILYHTHT